MFRKYLGDLFIQAPWYFFLCGLVVLYVLAYFLEWLFPATVILTLSFFGLSMLDYLLLFAGKRKLSAKRRAPRKMNLADNNEIVLQLYNRYPFRLSLKIIDEVPEQLQERNFLLRTKVNPGQQAQISYAIRPLSRGVYTFGRLLCYCGTPLGLLMRRQAFAVAEEVKVYPSVKYLRQFQLWTHSDHKQFPGSKKIRRLGHSIEFEQIKEYVSGDDLRSINWKTTARKNSLMVNHYTDVRSQPIYCIIDKGRSMKMPFDGLSLLDYSINAALLFLNVALLKQDKAGLLSFAGKVTDLIPAEHTRIQMHRLNEALYRQVTQFDDSDYEALSSAIFRKITQRSFLLLFTNFETLAALDRQLPYLRKLASRHLVCVVLFQNTLLQEIEATHPDNLEGIYIKTIAERFQFEKKQIQKELRRYGILSILSSPQELSVAVVNKYLEIKARQQI